MYFLRIILSDLFLVEFLNLFDLTISLLPFLNNLAFNGLNSHLLKNSPFLFHHKFGVNILFFSFKYLSNLGKNEGYLFFFLSVGVLDIINFGNVGSDQLGLFVVCQALLLEDVDFILESCLALISMLIGLNGMVQSHCCIAVRYIAAKASFVHPRRKLCNRIILP